MRGLFKKIQQWFSSVRFWEWVLLGIAILGILASIVSIGRQFKRLGSEGVGMPHMHRRWLHFIPIPGRQSLQPGQIREWMTFRYINREFSLPSDYLQQQLKISAKNYPDITVEGFAEQNKQNVIDVISKIQQSISSLNTVNQTVIPSGHE